jgi:hypothetical protein
MCYTNLPEYVVENFDVNFAVERDPSRTIHNLVNKLRTTRLLIDRKMKHKRWVLTEEKLDDIWARLNIHLENHWNVYLKRLEYQSLVQERQHNCWSLDPIEQQKYTNTLQSRDPANMVYYLQLIFTVCRRRWDRFAIDIFF